MGVLRTSAVVVCLLLSKDRKSREACATIVKNKSSSGLRQPLAPVISVVLK
jgi:hypothetical protein